ncbi:hypothetical protein ACIODW_12165 [Streptomyces sp. NPDC087897]|uniref:hypothetical protein n=1 Tax=Streptomyces sp. NPDC087897 TaxID=3365817 RepID=UPI0037F4F758
MHEGSIPLEDFLDTLNRLQADFERRLGGIEHQPAPLSHSAAQDRSGTSAWTQEDGYRPLGLAAIWTSPSTPPHERSSPRRGPVVPHHGEPFPG